jgi:regulator of protease activity HflC (stomatin/prohibitin superfamily)
VNYRIPADRVQEVYATYGGEDGLLSRLIERKVFEETKTVFGRFNAVTAIQERGRLNAEIASAIQQGVSGPVLIDSVQIENIDFSDAYEASIEQRMLAEVEVQRLRQNAEREKVQAEITVTQARAQADARRAEAQAQADAVRLAAQAESEAIRLRGEAEAEAIKARGDALKDNPGLVALTQAEKWDGQLPRTMLPGGAVPMLNLNPN